MKKKVLILCLTLGLSFTCVGCASWDRFKVDMKSDVGGGLERTINVYTADGKLMKA